MEMTLLPMMETTTMGLTEHAPAGSVATTAVADNNLFATLFDTATLAVESLLRTPGQVDPQAATPQPENCQNGVAQVVNPEISLQFEQLNLPTVEAEPLIAQLPVSDSTPIDTPVTGESILAADRPETHTSETKPAKIQNELEAEMAALAMASAAGQQRQEPIAPPANMTAGHELVVDTTAAVMSTAAEPAQPVVTSAANQLAAEVVAVPKTVSKNEMVAVLSPEIPVQGQETIPAREELAVPMVTTAEQKISKVADTAKQSSAPQIEALSVQEPRKQAASLPLDVAIEVGITEQSSPLATAAESGLYSEQHGQEQSPSSSQQFGQVAPHPAKIVEPPVAASMQPSAQPISQSVLEQVRDHLARREVSSDGNQVRMQLNPAELGELQITLHMDDKRLRVEILTENKAVKSALLENMDSLKDILARQHIAMDRFDVGTGSNSGQFFREGTRPEVQARTLPKFLNGNGIKLGAETGAVAAWQPRSNALVDVRF